MESKWLFLHIIVIHFCLRSVHLAVFRIFSSYYAFDQYWYSLCFMQLCSLFSQQFVNSRCSCPLRLSHIALRQSCMLLDQPHRSAHFWSLCCHFQSVSQLVTAACGLNRDRFPTQKLQFAPSIGFCIFSFTLWRIDAHKQTFCVWCCFDAIFCSSPGSLESCFQLSHLLR